MTRGHVGWVALLLAVSGGGCASRKEATESKAPTEQKEAKAMATALECAMSVPESVRAGEPVELRFQLTNRSDQPLSVITWRTPLEGLFGNDFQVTRDGTDIPYQGPMMKRGNPQAEDYVTLAPGASAEGQVELSLAYEMNQPGRYRIEFRGPVMDVAQKQADVPRTLEQLQPMPVKCPVVETTVTAG